tara:strand:- start:225 stop:680 length:456 start_codon:yes stop_codon:yes gene_type:complete
MSDGLKKSRHRLLKIDNGYLTKKIISDLELLPELLYCLEGHSFDFSKDWCYFINYIIKFLKKSKLVTDFNNIKKDKLLADKRLFNEQRYRFFFPNSKEINYVNTRRSIISKGYNFTDDELRGVYVVQFQPLIYIYKNKAYLINKITGLLES